MARFFKDRSKSFGQAPGSLVFIGRKKLQEPEIRYMEFNQTEFSSRILTSIDQYNINVNNNLVDWINIIGLHDTNLIKSVGETFSVDSLLLEDILNTDHRPKVEDAGEFLFFVIKILKYDKPNNRLSADQLSVIMGQKFVLTFLEEPSLVLDPLIDRLKHNKGRIRSCGADYLAYAIIDTVVDSYIYIIEDIGDKIENLEKEIINTPKSETIRKIFMYKTEINFLRKNLRPLKELMLELKKIEGKLINKKTLKYFRDLQDLINQANEGIETYSIMVTDQLNIYNSNISNRLNEIMKVLTVFSALFIPLTFLAGVYGTNFEFLPEIKWRFGYLFFWIVLIIMALLMLFFFKRRKWL